MIIIADIIRERQPQVYNALIDVFGLADIEVEEQGPITYVDEPEFPEDDPLHWHYKRIMQERKAVEM